MVDRMGIESVVIEVQSRLELAFGVVYDAAKVGQSLSYRAGDLGELFGPEDDQRNQRDHHDLERTDLGHVTSLRSAEPYRWVSVLRGVRGRSEESGSGAGGQFELPLVALQRLVEGKQVVVGDRGPLVDLQGLCRNIHQRGHDTA